MNTVIPFLNVKRHTKLRSDMRDNEAQDQQAHSRSLIQALHCTPISHRISVLPHSGQCSFDVTFPDAQSESEIRCTHLSECTFSRDAYHLIFQFIVRCKIQRIPATSWSYIFFLS